MSYHYVERNAGPEIPVELFFFLYTKILPFDDD